MSWACARRPRAHRRRGGPMGAESEPPGDVPIRLGPAPPGPGPRHLPTGFVTEASGDRSIAVGGDATGSVFMTGNVYQYIVQHYPSLKDHAIDFDDLIQKETKRFVGRVELFRRLDDFAKMQPCGYFRVVADAGLGKTALAAAVAKRPGALAFFA